MKEAMLELHTKAWAMEINALHALAQMVRAGVTMTPEAARGQTKQPQGVAVIPIMGTVVPRGGFWTEFFGGASVQAIRRSFAAALNDAEVGHIVLEIDSPGGQVGGVAELADMILQARGTKPVTAVANTLAASAAYWIASAADEIAVTPSGEVGSIGVFALHQDWSGAYEQAGVTPTLISAGKYKTAGNPYQPLSEESREIIQGQVDGYYEMFTAAVAAGRGVSQEAVQNGYGEGRVVAAKEAVALGLADRVATLDEVIGGALASLSAPVGMLAGEIDKRKRRLRAASLRAMLMAESVDSADSSEERLNNEQ